MPKPTPQDFIAWTNTLVHLLWPIQLNDLAPYAEKLGWKPTLRPTWFSVYADDDVGNVIVGENESGNIYRLRVSMARSKTEDFKDAAELNDHSVSCVVAGRKAWGESFPLEVGEDPATTWKFPEGALAQVTGGSRAVLFRFFTPQGQWYFV